MTDKPPLSRKKKITRWVLVAFMGLITILETLIVITTLNAEGCGALGAGILLAISIPFYALLLIILLIIWLILGRRKIADIQEEINQNN